LTPTIDRSTALAIYNIYVITPGNAGHAVLLEPSHVTATIIRHMSNGVRTFMLPRELLYAVLVSSVTIALIHFVEKRGRDGIPAKVTNDTMGILCTKDGSQSRKLVSLRQRIG
jgi:hypothetical protein